MQKSHTQHVIKTNFKQCLLIAGNIFSLLQSTLYSCQQTRTVPVQDIVHSYKHIDEGFDLTEEKVSFYDFLKSELHVKNILDENFTQDFAHVIAQAESIILDRMKDTFLDIVTTAAQQPIPVLSNLDHPYYSYLKKNHTKFSQPYIKKLINTHDEDGNTILHKVVNTFIFKPNSHEGIQQQRSLMCIVSDLIAMGADVNLVNNKGLSCLHFIQNYKITGILLYAGVYINPQESNGLTPLHLAAAHKNHQKDECCKVTLLLYHGANPHIPDHQGKKPLHVAVQYNNLRAVQALLRKQVDSNAADMNGWTPLHYAAKYNSSDEITRNLLCNDACIDSLDRQGKSPLYIAVQFYHAKIVQTLIDAGADITIFKRQPNVALHKSMYEILQNAPKSQEKRCTIS